MKRLAIIVGGILLLILVSVAALPFLIDPNTFRPLLESQLSSTMARQVTLGDLKLSIFRGSVTATNLSIADDPAYSRSPFVQAKSVAIGVELWPLLTSRKLNVTGLTIDQPAVNLIQSPSSEWNFSSLGGKSPAKVAPAASPAEKNELALSIKLIRIAGGRFSLATAGRREPLALRDVDLEIKDFSPTAEFPFHLQAKVNGGGTLALDGKAGPVNSADTAASPFTGTVKLDAVDLKGSGLTAGTPALAGIVTLEANIRSDGRDANIQGKVKAEKLRLSLQGTPANKAADFAFALDHNFRRRGGRLRTGDIRIGAAPASLTGTYVEAGPTTSVHFVLDGPKMPVDELTGFLPAMAITLPRGSSLQGGTASIKMTAEGPLDRLVTDGNLAVDNTKLANFDIGRKLEFVQALAGIPSVRDTDIQTLRADVHFGPEGGRVDNLQLVVPSIGNLDGAGTVSPAHDLAFQMQATVKTYTVPFTVQGTAADPTFRPNVKSLAKQEAQKALGSEKVKGLLKGILGK